METTVDLVKVWATGIVTFSEIVEKGNSFVGYRLLLGWWWEVSRLFIELIIL